MVGIINRIPTTIYEGLTNGSINLGQAIGMQLNYAMGNWWLGLIAIGLAFSAYIRTGNLAFSGGLGMIMALLMFEMPVYVKGILWVLLVLGVAMAIFKVVGRREQ